MAKSKKINLYDIFDKGTEFFKSVNDTINLACGVLGTFTRKGTSSATNNNNRNNKNTTTTTDDKQIKISAYRFMKLESGCGLEAVKCRFREMVKEQRPDISDGEINTKWFVALQTARKTLLKYEK